MEIFKDKCTVLVTGANGFIGSAICNALMSENVELIALTEPNTDISNLKGIQAKVIEADIRDFNSLDRAFKKVDYIFHCAAIYRFNSKDKELFYDVNVKGSINVVKAALSNNVKKIVYTSTVGTVGLKNSRVSTEDCFADISHLYGNYKRSKYVAEHEVLRLAARGAPVVLVQPTMPVGPRDIAPSPSGKMVVDFLNKKMIGYADTVMNIVDVDDVAHGHLLAMDKGKVGFSYIVGGENLTMKEILDILEAVTNFKYSRARVPNFIILSMGYISEFVEVNLLSKTPSVPLEAAKMATSYMAFDDSFARKTLGYSSRPAKTALLRSCSWYLNNGYVKPQFMNQIKFNST